MDVEIWKDIPGHEGYQASSFGRVRSIDRTIKRKDGILWRSKGRILRQRISKDGYIQYQLSIDKKNKIKYAHRLVALAFVENPNNLQEVNHINEDRKNNRPENLEWCSHEYNSAYGMRGKRISEKLKTQVILEKNGESLLFDGITNAAGFLGVRKQSITYAISHNGRTKGYTVRKLERR